MGVISPARLGLPPELARLNQTQRRAWLTHARTELHRLTRSKAWQPYPWQKLPDPTTRPAHSFNILMGGRGSGKSFALAQAIIDHVNQPPCDPKIPGGHRIAIIGPTLGDVIESLIKGPSGITTHDRTARLRVHDAGGTHLVWPSGAEAKIFGGYSADDVERLRAGGNRCHVALEEAAAIRQLSGVLEHSAMGLRIGPNPHYVVATTPKPRKELRELLSRPSTVLLRGRTADAHHLPQEVRDQLVARYAGTRLGRQELDGELLEDVEGALWTLYNINRSLIAPEDVPPLTKTVTVMDPPGTQSSSSDECGLIAVGLGTDGHAYVLGDYSGTLAGLAAGRKAWALFDATRSDKMLYEQRNQWVEDILWLTWPDPTRKAPIDYITAKESKLARAEPVAALWELDEQRAYLAGEYPLLIEQLTTWTPGQYSPDRLDAMVHAIRYLVDVDAPPVTGYRSPYRGYSAYD